MDDNYIDEIVKQDWNDVAIDDNDQYWNYNKIVNKLDYQDYNGVKIKDNISDLFWDSNWIVHRIYYGCERINESWDDSDVIDEIHEKWSIRTGMMIKKFELEWSITSKIII